MEAARAENEEVKRQTFPQYNKRDRRDPAIALDRRGYATKDSGVPAELCGRYN
ncbi:hypothetical protein sscle_01g003890 [Sclerotinia sclerotiorum 1980 UF-70]|uniref:Uncharacterized protein n=1 Tax=Sclerotinia sclerotiorum (strain ATCC 18683 / 1980 / Ss-1) TaxID=665079 RepID=A0A1D9PSL7_SCLS1|nr:hypothetical protein sscle_01g003890 [Sclerotinia sclerotiorum 1980 UF-70]